METKLIALPERAIELVGKWGGQAMDLMPSADKLLDTGAKLGALKGGSKVAMKFARRYPLVIAATALLSAINAASPYLPAGIPYPPTIRKVNPADTPILVLAVTSDTLPLTTVDAYADNILLQKISQISGVGLVGIAGEQKAAIRIQLDPQALAARGIIPWRVDADGPRAFPSGFVADPPSRW